MDLDAVMGNDTSGGWDLETGRAAGHAEHEE
jgi:hypothetical protein